MVLCPGTVSFLFYIAVERSWGGNFASQPLRTKLVFHRFRTKPSRKALRFYLGTSDLPHICSFCRFQIKVQNFVLKLNLIPVEPQS